MTKAVWTTMAAAALLAVAAPVAAQSATDSASVLVTATVNAKAKLTLNAAREGAHLGGRERHADCRRRP